MKHISRTMAIQLNAPPDQTLPLFTAVGECLWIPDWEPTYIYPESGEPQTGMIWKTSQYSNVDSIWITAEYDTVACHATYIRFTPERHVARIDVQCDSIDGAKTIAEVTYSVTAIHADGHEDIEMLTEARFREMIGWWEKAINHYLESGEMLQEA